MAFTTGTRLGPYEIVEGIGSGGFGQVYKARDMRLNRFVAIKLLPEHLSKNAISKARLEREEHILARFSYPHICPHFDIGEQSSIDYLVMEFLEGETLQARLSKGPLPLNYALSYAIDIVGALAAAHRLGITHRDLKPANVMLTKSG